MNHKRLILNGGIALILAAGTCANAKAHNGSDLPALGDVESAGKLVDAGNAAAAVGHMQEALMNYRDALTASPFYEDAEIGAARSSAMLGDYGDAITYYRSSINGHHEEDDIDEQAEYIEVLVQAGRDQEAIAPYNHIVGLCANGLTIRKMEIVPPTFLTDGSDYDPVEMRAMIHLMRAMDCDSEGDTQAAAEIQKAAALAPDSPLVYFYEGVLLDHANKPGAKKAFQQALDLDDGTNAKVIQKWIALAK